MKFAVVGGGIAGLAAAWELVEPDASGPNVTVFEAGQLGGKLRTTSFLGQPVDEAPDSLITRVPEGVALCEELGLSDSLVAPAATRAVLFAQGKLRPLPGGLVLGAPARLLPLMRSRILSPAGMARASFDAVLPRSTLGADASVFSLISSRFGSEVADRLVEPLLGTIHAGTTKQLSAAATAPQLLNAAQDKPEPDGWAPPDADQRNRHSVRTETAVRGAPPGHAVPRRPSRRAARRGWGPVRSG